MTSVESGQILIEHMSESDEFLCEPDILMCQPVRDGGRLPSKVATGPQKLLDGAMIVKFVPVYE